MTDFSGSGLESDIGSLLVPILCIALNISILIAKHPPIEATVNTTKSKSPLLSPKYTTRRALVRGVHMRRLACLRNDYKTRLDGR